VWPVLALGAFVGIVLHVAASLRHRTPAPPSAAPPPDAEPAPPSVGGEPAAPVAPALRWGRVFTLVAASLALVGLMGVAVRVGVIGIVLRGMFYGLLGAGAAYYLSFVVPQRWLHGPLAQVWGLLGAAAGLAVGSGHWTGLLIGVALGAGALAWARRRTVEASPASTEELSAHGYLPFGVGLSIAAILLGYTGGFQRVREIFAEIAPGLGL
jgi:hypothetical protein